LVIASWLEDHPIGRIYYAPVGVVFSNFDVVEPDLIYLSHARMAEIATPNTCKARLSWSSKSDRSTRKRDETIKKRLYERWGVSE
jgi:Uma2 family endonuclease